MMSGVLGRRLNVVLSLVHWYCVKNVTKYVA